MSSAYLFGIVATDPTCYSGECSRSIVPSINIALRYSAKGVHRTPLGYAAIAPAKFFWRARRTEVIITLARSDWMIGQITILQPIMLGVMLPFKS